MRRFYILLLAMLAVLLIPQFPAWSALSDYQFAATSSTYTPLIGATAVITSTSTGGVYAETATAGPYNIGFNFVFNGTTYTQFSVNTGGLMVLGNATTSVYSNQLESPPVTNPILAPFWDHLHMYDGSATCTPAVDVHVSYLLSGSSPNRILTVEWHTQMYNDANSTYYYAGNCLPFCTFQVRLYEGAGQFSYTYGAFRQNTTSGIYETASIGFAQGSNNFVSITPSGTSSSATKSLTTANNSVDNYNLVTSTTLIPSGTVYTFNLCGLRVTGRTGATDGGTATMTPGDTLFKALSVQRGNSATFTPFSLDMPTGSCPTVSYSVTISGSSDYYFGTPGTLTSSGTVSAGNSTIPQITFKPGGLGPRNATLTVNDLTNNAIKTYLLRATGTTRINWIGNTLQGGTAAMASGDTILKNINVNRRSSQTFTPFTLQDFNINVAQSPLASITYTINDPTGQYSISPSGATLGASQTSTPTITFSPTGVGSQSATLTVNADGEIRTFVLYAFSAAPGANFILGGQILGPGVGAFVNQSNCAGEFANTQAITVSNTGVGNVLINSINFYQTDTVYRQGTPAYPLLRDANGNAIPMRDYFLSLQPGVAPTTANPALTLPIVIQSGTSPTIYITFVGQYPGKRFARAFINTNAQNFTATDIYGNQVEGLLTFDLFGRATSARLSDVPGGVLPKAVTFPATRVGDSVDVTFSLSNSGTCDLRISKSGLRIAAGDANEFILVSGFAGISIDNLPGVRSDYILAPGVTTALTVRFKPSRSGSRRATLLLKTNDSTIQIPSITERGVYYLDLYGIGKAGLDYKNLTLPPAVIDAPAASGGTSTGFVELTNSSEIPILIANLAITGANATEIMQDASNPWPTLPATIPAGQSLQLGIALLPTAGSQPGIRTAQLDITLASGETFSAAISGYAGTRTITVMPQTPATLFNGATVLVGSLARQTIAVSNSGTLPLTLQQPQISGLDAAEFQVEQLVRTVLDPGQTEFLEVTYAPSKKGAVSAQVDIMSDATNGKQSVLLNATGGVTHRGEDPSSQSVAGVGAVSSREGMSLGQSVPNPARGGEVTISYRLGSAAEVALVLYDAAGHVVKVIEQGTKESGEHTVKLDVSGLSSGQYGYRLTANGTTLTQQLTVVR